ncbi:LAFE_0G14818g1_1 [Lachancea fermentati]|uniref:LAFE_0G14818g1_1 n=1 Tax=Lachancea fermentati TaxID=4955 RepID=A0A1G4MIE4_LACFM|nr:LAFE_0G14818g1_1 [Lachancea fermentati]
MPQKDLTPMSAKPSALGQDSDDDSTVVPSEPQGLVYDRNNGSLIDDDAGTMNNDVSYLLSHHSNHCRTASNDKMLSMHLSQWNYNNNRVGLSRSILSSEELIHELLEENEVRPINVPQDHNLHILGLNLKLDGNLNRNLQLDQSAEAKLFHHQGTAAIAHLRSLQKRVDDTSSKIFITGDLNAGKSTFCNSLLKRRLLPVDQLPCTNVFCEILEARENNDIEEVHAITIEVAATVKEATQVYDISNRSTYETFSIKQLSDLVYENKKYSLLKVYIKDDKRSAESSLLRNGTIDISLIDSPGLNMDSIKTTEVMSRQEEIDLVIFVVNSENQLTLSGKEFISVASREKKLIFFVVNKFDQIRDKERCKKLILDQIKSMSPETYKQSREFVHFVSSGKKPGFPDDYDSDEGDDDDNNENPDFANLESNLRNFILKKRSLSKLLPAKTYLAKLLSDIEAIAGWNLNKFNEERTNLNDQLDSMRPEIQAAKDQCMKLTETVDKLMEDVATEVYQFTKKRINSSLNLSISDFPQYEGLSNIHDYIFRTRQFIMDQIKQSVETSEFFAKSATEKAVENINEIGKAQLGEKFMSNRVFLSELMFTKKKHSALKALSVPFDVADLFSPSWEGFTSYLSWGFFASPQLENSAGSSIWSTSLGIKSQSVTKYWSSPSLLFTSRIPTLAVYSWGGAKFLTNIAIYGTKFFSWQSLRRMSTSIILIGSILGIAYLIHDLPRALPSNLSHKYQIKLQETDYTDANANRISKEVREVLKFPSREILKYSESVLNEKQTIRKETEKKLQNNILSLKFFNKLLDRARSQSDLVEQVNLDVD